MNSDAYLFHTDKYRPRQYVENHTKPEACCINYGQEITIVLLYLPHQYRASYSKKHF